MKFIVRRHAIESGTIVISSISRNGLIYIFYDGILLTQNCLSNCDGKIVGVDEI